MAYVSLIGLVNDRYENHTLRVRILHIHGLPDNAITDSSNDLNRTKDEDLPIIPHEIPSSVNETDYGPGALVRIECPTGELGSAIVSRVIRTASEMAGYDGSLTPLLKSIPNDDVTIEANTDALYSEQAVVSGGSSTGASRYIPEYQTFFGYPFDTYYPITSNYGYRSLGDGSSGFHVGIDIGVSSGVPIYSVANGVVVCAMGNWTKACGISGMQSYGNYVTIDHGICPYDGIHYYTHYAHMQAICVNVGDTVQGTQNGNIGTQIGIVGHTGHCYPDSEAGSHLHFEVLKDISWHNEANTFNPMTRVKFN